MTENNDKEKENTVSNKTVTNFLKYLKSGPGITIIIFILNCLGYIYMISYLSYFNIDKSFYELNLFNDFISLIVSYTIIALPFLSCFLISILIFLALRIPDKINYIKTHKKEGFQFFGLIIILLVIFPILTQYVVSSYKIDFIVMLKWYSIFAISEIAIAIILSFVYDPIKKWFKNDLIDLIYIIFIILSLLLLSISNIGKHSQIIAGEKRNFIIIENEQVVLYNTSNYAIVAPFEFDQENNIANIYTSELTKIDLTNLKFKNHTFKEVIIIRE